VTNTETQIALPATRGRSQIDTGGTEALDLIRLFAAVNSCSPTEIGRQAYLEYFHKHAAQISDEMIDAYTDAKAERIRGLLHR
jgi:hypothetical protein